MLLRSIDIQAPGHTYAEMKNATTVYANMWA